MLNEDAPANATPGVAGLGVGPQGEPGVPVAVQKRRYGKTKSIPNPIMIDILRRKPLMEETFAGAAVFEVDSKTFYNAKVEKRKGKHWKTYLDEDESLAEIREYARKHPHKPIVLKNRTTSEMCYCRYGRKGY